MTTTHITAEQVFQALPADGAPIYARDLTARLGASWPDDAGVIRERLLALERRGHAHLVHGAGWHRVMATVVLLSQYELDEFEGLAREALAAADGDSNDAEIEALQAALDAAIDALRIPRHRLEPEPEADPWSADPITPARH